MIQFYHHYSEKDTDLPLLVVWHASAARHVGSGSEGRGKWTHLPLASASKLGGPLPLHSAGPFPLAFPLLPALAANHRRRHPPPPPSSPSPCRTTRSPLEGDVPGVGFKLGVAPALPTSGWIQSASWVGSPLSLARTVGKLGWWRAGRRRTPRTKVDCTSNVRGMGSVGCTIPPSPQMPPIVS
jgi:hypothetical protein